MHCCVLERSHGIARGDGQGIVMSVKHSVHRVRACCGGRPARSGCIQVVGGFPADVAGSAAYGRADTSQTQLWLPALAYFVDTYLTPYYLDFHRSESTERSHLGFVPMKPDFPPPPPLAFHRRNEREAKRTAIAAIPRPARYRDAADSVPQQRRDPGSPCHPQRHR